MIYLYGASGHAKVILDILELNQESISGLVDDNPTANRLFNYEVTQAAKITNFNTDKLIISIGNNAARKRIAHSLKVDYVNAIHPEAVISEHSQLGSGIVVMAGTVVNAGVWIGDHVILNTSCSVDHDCKISDFVHISPNASLAGNVEVGEGSNVGIGACVIQGIKIGKWATIGAGTVVINDVPDYAVVVGNPGKIIKYNQPEPL